MLLGISIRDIVLIDKLDLTLEGGLCALTGETGAGKSILLDALGLALGLRADSGLVRHGARQGTVAAEFAVAPDHPALADALCGDRRGGLVPRQDTPAGQSAARGRDCQSGA